MLAATANPEAPNEVKVTRPSDALAAKAKVNESLTALLLGLGAVALLVGGVGIANVMVISVLERRAEIGVRRALGATRRHIRLQFLVESMLLAALGGTAGVGIGAAITKLYADSRDWTFTVPVVGLVGGIAASLLRRRPRRPLPRHAGQPAPTRRSRPLRVAHPATRPLGDSRSAKFVTVAPEIGVLCDRKWCWRRWPRSPRTATSCERACARRWARSGKR